MDGTLLSGRLVFALSEGLGLGGKVRALQERNNLPNFVKTEMIAALFAGVKRSDIESAVESIPLAANCEKAVRALQERGFKTGIISDSYTAAAGAVARRLGMDFVSANDLEFAGDGSNAVATGRVRMPLGWEQAGCDCQLSVCKRFHLEKHAREYCVSLARTLAVGDTRSDICMIRRAGLGIAFMPKDDDVARAAAHVIRTPDMMQVVRLADDAAAAAAGIAAAGTTTTAAGTAP